MKKSIVFWSIMVLCLASVQADVEPNITFTAPAEGATLRIGSQYTIRWTHNSYFSATDTAHLFLGFEQIGDAPATSDSFTWTVGRKMDGSFAAPGNYYLDLEASDYQYTKNVNITLYELAFANRLVIKMIDACPNCFYLDTGKINLKLAGLAAVEVELVRGEEVIAKLGKFGAGLALPGMVKIVLHEPASRQASILAGYELRFLSLQGRNLFRQEVQLEKTR